MELTNAMPEKKTPKPRRINQEEFYYRNIILGELPADLTREKLMQELAVFGQLNKLELYIEPESKHPLYAIAEFDSRNDCEKAFEHFIEKAKVDISYYCIAGSSHKDLVDFHRGHITHPTFPDLDFSNPGNFLPLMRKVQKTSGIFTTTGSSTYDPYVPEKVNNYIKSIVIGGLGSIPVIGGLVSGIFGALWPNLATEDVWDSIEERTEALINKKIDQHIYDDTNATLQGLGNVLNNYIQIVKGDSNPTEKSAAFIAAHMQFLSVEPKFMVKGSEVLLLPLFAHYVNLYLSLLNDGLNFGATYNTSPATLSNLQNEMNSKTLQYQNYATSWYKHIVSEQKSWSSKNKMIREFTIGVMDHCDLWPYFNPVKYPNKTNPAKHITRELYSDLYGGDPGKDFKDPYTISFAKDVPKGLNAAVKLSNYNYDAKSDQQIVQNITVFYNGTDGPGGVGTTGPMGNTDMFSTAITEYNNKPGCMDQLQVRVGSALYQLVIGNYHASATPGVPVAQYNVYGSLNPKSGIPVNIYLEDHVISSIHVFDATFVNHYKGCKNILVGFRLKSSVI